MINKIIPIVVLFFITSTLSAQSSVELLLGEVSFVTSKSIYVKFKNTEHIEVGDALLEWSIISI